VKKIRVSLKDRSYDILIGDSVLKDSGRILSRLDVGNDALVITNRPIAALYKRALSASLVKSGFTVRFEYAPDSEKAKTAKVALGLINKISAYDSRRRLFIIALGGGVIGDLAGFIAAVYKRGIPYVHIPTTLLAQVDSSVGGKVAIDLPVAKNIIGAFYQPRAVLSDITLLKTLSKRQIRNGLAEIVKYGVIQDPGLFKFIEKSYKKLLDCDKKALQFVVEKSAGIKSRVVGKDEFDNKGLRAILNFGHTLGHAIESAAGYSKAYYHGEAISVGMVIAAEISRRLGILKNSDAARIGGLLREIGLPTSAGGVRFADVCRSYIHDKKFVGKNNRLVLPERIGRVRIVSGVSDSLIKSVLKSYLTDR
jgi:3-dehydroquinate synthase